MKTKRLTVGQALVVFLKNQYVERDGIENQLLRVAWEFSVMVL
jgi:TPP-dependent trihydroxycyclohexane-1,2-dione (THcHDO) dehydratase